jgi:phosphoribosylpyrophosphate synthetase
VSKDKGPTRLSGADVTVYRIIGNARGREILIVDDMITPVATERFLE